MAEPVTEQAGLFISYAQFGGPEAHTRLVLVFTSSEHTPESWEVPNLLGKDFAQLEDLGWLPKASRGGEGSLKLVAFRLIVLHPTPTLILLKKAYIPLPPHLKLPQMLLKNLHIVNLSMRPP